MVCVFCICLLSSRSSILLSISLSPFPETSRLGVSFPCTDSYFYGGHWEADFTECSGLICSLNTSSQLRTVNFNVFVACVKVPLCPKGKCYNGGCCKFLFLYSSSQVVENKMVSVIMVVGVNFFIV